MNCRNYVQIGGHERRLIQLVRHFPKMGLRPYVVEYSQFRLNYGDNVGAIKLVNRLFSENIFGEFLRMLYLPPIIFHLCFRQHIDAIYLEKLNPFENTLSALLIKKLLGKPLILSKQEIPNKPSIKRKMSLWKGLGINQRDIVLWRLATMPIRRYVSSNADVVFAVSKQVAEKVQEYINRRVYVVGNGVDLQTFTPDFKATKSYEGCYIGRLHKLKGIETLLMCWRRVADKLPRSKLLIVGGSIQEITRYRAIATQLSLDENVVFKEWKREDADIVRLLRASKLFLFPSKYEGFPLSLTEAMACGLCCIISDIPVLREKFADGADYANPNNPDEFAKLALYYLNNEDEMKRMGIAAYELAKTFDWKYVAQNEAHIIKSTLRKKSRYAAN